MSHVWPDTPEASDAGARLEVRHVHPYQAEKSYRCPGCDHEIRKGEGHEVVVPVDDPGARRHWHSGCWHREARTRDRPLRRRR